MTGAAMVFEPTWMTTRRFALSKPSCMYHKEQATDPEDPIDITNYHVLARASLNLDKRASSFLLRITADDCYKLYVNGELITQGPAPAYPEHYYYNSVDITRFLHAGENVLAVHLYYQGLLNRVWNSRDGRFGVAADIISFWQDGTVVARDEPKWCYCETEAYGMGSTVGYETQFLEEFDSRLWDEQWAQERFDASTWEPLVPADWADYRLEPQPVRMLELHRLAPKAMETLYESSFKDAPSAMSGAGTIVRIDFGYEITATLSITACGKAGQRIVIRCGEEKNDDGSVRFNMRCNCSYEETWTLADGPSTLDQFDYKAFRYVELLIPVGVELHELHALERHYPLDESLCSVKSSDPWIEPVFQICKRGVKLGTQQGYLDCPSREKGQYLGDSILISHAQALLSGSVEMLEKCIDQFSQSGELIDRGLMGVAPGSFMQEIADFSLLWSQMLLTHYRFTGNVDFLARRYPIAKGVLDHFSCYQRPDGLLEQVADKWNLVDWPENLRDGYDFALTRPIVGAGCHNVINALWVGAAKTLCEIENVIGEHEHAYPWEPLRDAYISTFFQPETGLFVDAQTSSHSSLHANLYALYFGLCPSGSESAIADFMIGKGLCCGVLLSYYYLKGLARIGRHRDVLSTIVNETEHGWVNMLREGATTCWEAWGKDQKWNTSLCHAWAAAPVPVLIEDIAGFQPDPSAARGFRFHPHVPADLSYFELTVPFCGHRWRIVKDGKADRTHLICDGVDRKPMHHQN